MSEPTKAGGAAPPRAKPDLRALRERLRHKGDRRAGDKNRPEETGRAGGGP